jgi:murein L,D-transpeptidase YafK
MALCESGKLVREVSVAIGSGGVDKRREGDRKTPLGRYPIGAPHDSARFHRFIAVGYPTPAQRAGGRTGGDIGIHGPPRTYAWLGGARNWVNWTAGCIAVASDEVIDQVASWVVARRASVVVIQ